MSFADGRSSGVLSPRDAHAYLRSIRLPVVGHNIAYDLAVLCRDDAANVDLVFSLYDAGCVRDTMIRELLLRIREGTLKTHQARKLFSLSALAKIHLQRELQKEDTWRLRYGELLGVPIEDWPDDAVEYARLDAVTTLDVFEAQPSSPDEAHQCKAAFALHLMSVWGVRTEQARLEALEISLTETQLSLRQHLVDAGLMRRKVKTVKQAIGHVKRAKKLRNDPDADPEAVERAEARALIPAGTVDYSLDNKRLQAFVLDALGPNASRTEGNAVSTSVDTLDMIDDAPELAPYKAYVKAGKVLSTYVPALWPGVAHPINARFNVLVESGRTSCSKPNLQNPPRAGGVRACIVPRAGWLLIACDFDAFELCALAQILFWEHGGRSMMDAINAGRDLHLAFAASMLRISYDEAASRLAESDPVVKDARQRAKVANFGFPGGLGAATFTSYARGYGLDVSEEDAAQLKAEWFEAWPEMRSYFAEIAKITDDLKGSKRLTQFGSFRVRGNVSFCQAANSFFQGLAADAAKEALWQVALRCYVDKTSPLFGCRPVMFLHDELILETPADRASDAAGALSTTMNDAASKWIPNVKISSSPAITRRWLKGAEPTRDAQGKLTITEEEKGQGK